MDSLGLRSVLGFVAGLFVATSSVLWAQSDLNRIEHSSGPLGQMMIDLFEDKPELSKYDRLNCSAMEQLAIRDYREAFKLLKMALEMEPEAPDAYVNFGLVHLERKEYASSEKAIEAALKRDPENARAWYWYSRVMMIKGEMNEARESSSRAVAYSEGEDWKYLDWQAILLFDNGHYEKAANASEAALNNIRVALERVGIGISKEEAKEEVASLEQDTEIVRELGGVIREVPVTRVKTEYKNAPNEWYDLKEHLEEHMGNVAFRHAMSLAKLGSQDELQDLLEIAFMASRGRVHEGLFHFAFMDYDSSAKSLKRPVQLRNANITLLFGYLIDQIALNDHSGARNTLGKLKKRMLKEKAYWVADALEYLGEFAPEVNAKGLPKGMALEKEEEALSAFYKAQLHLTQERFDLAKPWLEKALGSLFDMNFESKAAEAQLALFYEN